MESSFRKRVLELLEAANAIEKQNQEFLLGLVDQLIEERILSGEAKKNETNLALKSFYNQVKHPKRRNNYASAKLHFQTEDEAITRFEEAYERAKPTIRQLDSKELCRLIERVRTDPLLMRVLGSCSKKTTGPTYVRANEQGPIEPTR